MSLEKKIIAACVKSRAAFDRIEEHIGTRITLPFSEAIIEYCRDYYARDGNARSVDVEWIKGKIDISFDNPKKADEYKSFLSEVLAEDVSVDNIAELIIETKRKDIRNKLAVAFANDSENIAELIDEYNSIGLKSIDDSDEDEVYNNTSVAEIVSDVLDPSKLIKLPTKALNEAIDGGAMRQHHIIIFARPETGKTALCIAVLRALAYQGLKVIYFGNEDPIRQIILRCQCAFTGMTKEQIRANPEEAQKRLDESNFHLIRFIPLTPGSPAQIRKYLKMYEPDAAMLDQLRNINVKADTRVNQLEAAATFQRNVAREFNLLNFSITQAGDSAGGKLVLDMGDVDFSNTGIPAQADLMIGIGVDNAFDQQGLRMISLPKNKLSGKHVHFPLRLNNQLSRYEDI